MARNQLVIFPGSFDPFTLGHLDIVARASAIFGRVEVAIGINDAKKGLLSPDERLSITRDAVKDLENVEATTFEGLISEYARTRGAAALIRGLRQAGDFEYEARMAYANSELARDIETIFLPSAAEYACISSTIVRDVYRWGGDVSAFVPPSVAAALERRRSQS